MSTVIHWHRRDLRLDDNAGLYHALKSGNDVQPIFIFDTEILDKLEDKDDARVTFIHQELEHVNSELEELGSTIKVYYGKPAELWPQIIEEHNPLAVYTNRDYEPYALERDAAVEELLQEHNIDFNTYKDHVIFEKDEVVKDDGEPYVVYTPYSKKWNCLLYTSPSPRDRTRSRMPSSA